MLVSILFLGVISACTFHLRVSFLRGITSHFFCLWGVIFFARIYVNNLLLIFKSHCHCMVSFLNAKNTEVNRNSTFMVIGLCSLAGWSEAHNWKRISHKFCWCYFMGRSMFYFSYNFSDKAAISFNFKFFSIGHHESVWYCYAWVNAAMSKWHRKTGARLNTLYYLSTIAGMVGPRGCLPLHRSGLWNSIPHSFCLLVFTLSLDRASF